MFHKVVEVSIKENLIIIAKFKDGTIKEYDTKKLVDKYEIFRDLKNKELFELVKVDKGGYGISWNEKIDLSSEEIWKNGKKIK